LVVVLFGDLMTARGEFWPSHLSLCNLERIPSVRHKKKMNRYIQLGGGKVDNIPALQG
jgi:hypothetical protein